MNISVLGCGRWGSFIAWYLDKIGHSVLLWGREKSENLIQLIKERKNNILKFEKSLIITHNLKEAVLFSDIIIISISAQNLREFMKKLQDYDLDKKIIILCMKGIEEKTGLRLTQVTKEFVSSNTKIAIWVGPGHAQDLSNGIPNCMVIDSEDDNIKNILVKHFSSDLIRFYYGNDIIGNEIGAAAKNVIGIAAGALDGMGLTSLKGPLMSRGPREIARLIKSMGGNEISAYGLCHLGDYQATLFSEHSRNRRFGENLVKGIKYNKLAEGVSTSKALVKLGEIYNVELPICKAVNQTINGIVSPKDSITGLFLRSIKQEFYK